MSAITMILEGNGLAVSYPNKSARKATLIDTVSGIQFFEDPFYGDDAGLWAAYKGQVAATDYFEVPDAEEIGEDPDDFMLCYL